MKEIKIDEFVCKIGQNAKENWELLDISNESNLFFHLSSFPSCYVILSCESFPDLDILMKCAELCRSNTKYKNIRNIKVDYTTCANVMKGTKVGEVVYKSNKRVKTIKLI